MLSSIKHVILHGESQCLTICVLHWRFPAAFKVLCYNYVGRTSKKGSILIVVFCMNCC